MQLVDDRLHTSLAHDGPRSKLTASTSANLARSHLSHAKGILAVAGLVALAANMASADADTYQQLEANYSMYKSMHECGGCGGDMSEVENNLILSIRDIFGEIIATRISGRIK